MDLSLKNSVPSPPQSFQRVFPNHGFILSPTPSLPKLPESNTGIGGGGVQIVRPIPRPPWSILWYQNLWSIPSTLTGQHTGEARSAASESDVGNGENSKHFSRVTTSTLRINERSSFSVLNNLSTNTVSTNNINDSNIYTFPHIPNEVELQHFGNSQRPHQSPMIPEKCNNLALLTAEQMFVAASTSLRKSKHQRQDLAARNYASEDNDSDNSENIVVTTTSNVSEGASRDSLIKSSSIDNQDLTECLFRGNQHNQHERSHPTNVILDIACCDGPVKFKRISNPNFALTVEHNEVCAPISPPPPPVNSSASKVISTPTQSQHQFDHHSSSSSMSIGSEGEKHSNSGTQDGRELKSSANVTTERFSSTSAVTTHKSYLCIYCNQSFKSLFCYQKHKKRHLNPVSVDITTTTANSTSYRGSGGGVGGGSGNKKGISSGASTGCSGSGRGGGGGGGGIIGIVPENTNAKTKDLNVQFFPCKKCGCKFPSYYFVHKHRKSCH